MPVFMISVYSIGNQTFQSTIPFLPLLGSCLIFINMMFLTMHWFSKFVNSTLLIVAWKLQWKHSGITAIQIELQCSAVCNFPLYSITGNSYCFNVLWFTEEKLQISHLLNTTLKIQLYYANIVHGIMSKTHFNLF